MSLGDKMLARAHTTQISFCYTNANRSQWTTAATATRRSTSKCNASRRKGNVRSSGEKE
jgi:hypothetical protein